MQPPAKPVTRALIMGMALAFCTLGLLAWLSTEVLEGDTARFDDHVRGVIHQHAAPPLTMLMRGFTNAGSPWVLWPMVVTMLYLLWRGGLRYETALLGVAMSGSIILEAGLKIAFHRPRPTPFFGLDSPASYSYPSGHALFSFCFYGTLAALTVRRVEEPARRALIWVVAAVMIFMIGLSRIYLGLHYASDVIAGYAAAFVWVTAMNAGFRLRGGRT